MNYQDILTEIGNGSALTAENAGRRIGRGKLSARGSATFDTLTVMDPDDLLG